MIESKIREFAMMEADEFQACSDRCKDASALSFNFDLQFDSFMEFLSRI